jgi:MarR family transcriptional regulator for hemolysin
MSSVDHELDAPPWRRVEGTIMATAKAIRRAYDRLLADLGLTLPDAMLLAYLDEAQPLTQVQLAQRLGSGRAVVGARIDALEARGAVRRRPDARDRRVWLVETTPAGRELVAAILEMDLALRQQLRTGISREERQQLAGLLLRLQHNLAGTLEGRTAPDVRQTAAP